MINLYLSSEEYEYDIHSLVKAFYPEEQVKFIKNSVYHTTQDKRMDKLKSPSIKNSDGEMKKNKAADSVTVDAYDSLDNLDLFIQMDFDQIQLSVFSGENEVYSDIKVIDHKHTLEEEKRNYRNILKKLLYNALNTLTNKELPWGTLTGVRPTKITLERLEQGWSDDVIREYMLEQYLCSEEKLETSLQVAKRELALLNEMDYKNGYSIYIGIPFCPSTCLYCSFTSYSFEKFGNVVEQYLQALFKEITYAATCYGDKKLTTIYVGGGTPTSLSEEQLDRLCSHIRQSLDFTYVMEFTVEAGRPDSITEEKLRILKKHGVSRISINPQTMRQKTLDLIGRKHTVGQVIDAFHLARSIGHDNINMDIIIGLPGENSEDISYTLEEIDKLKPDSLTVHTLAIKRAARLNIEKQNYLDKVPTDTTRMLQLSSDYAKSAGYLPYYLYRQKNMADNLENVGYAHFGKEGLYNILIMEEKQTIIALGAGGLSKFVIHEENRHERVENVKSLKDYVERIDEMIQRKIEFLNKYK